MKKALSGVMYVMKEMTGTFRPEEIGVFKHLSPECQKSRNYDDSSMDDDMCGKFGPVKIEDRECASPLGSVKMYRAARDQTAHVCRECIGVGKIAHLAKDCGPVKRSPEVN